MIFSWREMGMFQVDCEEGFLGERFQLALSGKVLAIPWLIKLK